MRWILLSFNGTFFKAHLDKDWAFIISLSVACASSINRTLPALLVYRVYLIALECLSVCSHGQASQLFMASYYFRVSSDPIFLYFQDFAIFLILYPPLIEWGLYCNHLVRPSVHTFVTDISASTGRNDFIFDIWLWHGDLYRVSPFQVYRTSIPVYSATCKRTSGGILSTT
jgi:hypothetical protein